RGVEKGHPQPHHPSFGSLFPCQICDGDNHFPSVEFQHARKVFALPVPVFGVDERHLVVMGEGGAGGANE
ncbi:hypothetical protein XENOCAPTIV_013269, partial [Xenoophorus captivus]